MPRFSAVHICVLLLIAGCTQFPDVDSTLSDQALAADYPTLAPMDQVLADAGSTEIDDESIEEVEARAESLRARADALRGQELDGTAAQN